LIYRFADLIAIPSFAAGAMEYWGLISFAMTSLLVDDEMSSEIEKQRVVQTVTHELAHQVMSISALSLIGYLIFI
jgi:aminopeptidase N